MYSDPAESGFAKGSTFPNGPWMPEDGVQRGSVGLTAWVIGDPLTPGYPSTKDAKPISKENNLGLVNIPSLPISWKDAQPLLEALATRKAGKEVPDNWKGKVPIKSWWTGGKDSPTVNLMNIQDEEEKQPIWNVMGRIRGIEQFEKAIIVGNHRDAWCTGTTDPGSGTAILLEVVRIFGDLLKAGWRPLRTIVFANWDGEEYNLIGSTEYVEENLDELRLDGLGYINVDTAVSGQDFAASGSPLYEKVMLQMMNRISDPVHNVTLRKLWKDRHQKIQPLGAGSDYVAFQDMAGVSSLDMSFDGPGYPYHSCYDNFVWMKKFGDPGWQTHANMAQLWALIILEMSDKPVLPYDFIAYAKAVQSWVEDLNVDVKKLGGGPGVKGKSFDSSALGKAADSFVREAAMFEKWEEEWHRVVNDAGNGFESAVMAEHRRSHNARMGNFESHLLDLEEGGGVSFCPVFVIGGGSSMETKANF
jgi:Peptidase family M28/Transferrin receptor-like dimerisation domain